MNQTTGRNFEVFTAPDFLAAVTQHIPDKGAQTVKYYGPYSNKARGQRAKADRQSPPTEGCSEPGEERGGSGPIASRPATTTRRIPSRSWRELIKKVWDADPMLCPKCGGEMKLIALIEEPQTIEDILRHLGIFEEAGGPIGSSPPPEPFRLEYTYEPFYDDLPFGPGNSFAE